MQATPRRDPGCPRPRRSARRPASVVMGNAPLPLWRRMPCLCHPEERTPPLVILRERAPPLVILRSALPLLSS